jgi:hypothetical protein
MTRPVQKLEGADYDLVPVTIANGAALSDAGDVSAGEIVGIELPTITNAALSFQVSFDGGITWRDLYNADGTTETSVGATTGARVVAAPAALKECAALAVRVRSGLTAAPVNQGADRAINLLVQRLVG